MTAKTQIRLLLADDQVLIRQGVKSIIAGTEIKVVHEASSGQEATMMAMEKDIDVVLLDVRMPDGDGLTALGRIKLEKPDLPVLIFSAFDNSANAAKAFALGASGFLLKTCGQADLLHAIRIAATGESIWSRQKLRRLSMSLKTPRAGITLEASLSEREAEVLRHVVEGATNKQIAVQMQIRCETVKEHVQQVLKKIGVNDRTQAAVWAVRNDAV